MKYLLTITLLTITTITFAIPPGHWQCYAIDATQTNFEAIGETLAQAQQTAIHACKQQSSKPASCKSAQSFCEQGPLSLIDDRCLVTDNAGHSWDTTGHDACKSAMDMCNQFLYLQAGPRGQCSVKHAN
jgi:hypothetical protein